jgi:hypothetical protein
MACAASLSGAALCSSLNKPIEWRAMFSCRLSRAKVLGSVVLLVAGMAMAIGRAAKQRVGTDFHVFWQAGLDFAQGRPLYEPLNGARQFIYPPIAAQVFQIFALFPLKVAAGLFYFGSVLLVVVAAIISRQLVNDLEPQVSRGRIPLVMAIVVSVNFILNILNQTEVNLVIFVMCLLGAQAFVQNHPIRAAGWITSATAIKLTPIFFCLWLLIRGSRRAAVAVLAFGIACAVLPILQRGTTQGLADVQAYHSTFLRQFAQGKVVTDYTNQNLAALIYRAVSADPARDRFYYAYLPSLQSSAGTIYRVAAGLLFTAFLLNLFLLRRGKHAITAFEICSIFLAGHLLSGITWKAHLVTLLFISLVFFSQKVERNDRPKRIALLTAWGGIAIIGLLGKDLVGDTIHHYLGGYSVYSWVLLYLFVLCLMWGHGTLRTATKGGARLSPSSPDTIP